MGLSAAAAPIWSHEGDVVAILSASGPAFRLPRERLVELGIEVKQVADTISHQMGYINKTMAERENGRVG